MTNYPLLKQGIHSNYKLFLVFAAALTMYIMIIITMFDPALGDVLAQFSKAMPEMMSLFGMNVTAATLIGFLSSYLYGFLMIIFPMIYIIIISTKLVVKHIDHGSMAFFLASPNSRLTFITTQCKLLLFSIVLLITYCTGIALITAESMFPNELDLPLFIMLNIGVLSLHICLSGLCFFASCITNETKNCLVISAGFPIFQFLVQMLANMGGDLENLKFFTFFSLFNPQGIIGKEVSSYVGIGVLFFIGFLFYSIGILRFAKRDLSI